MQTQEFLHFSDAVVSHITDFPGSQVLLMHFVWLLDVCHRMIGARAWY